MTQKDIEKLIGEKKAMQELNRKLESTVRELKEKIIHLEKEKESYRNDVEYFKDLVLLIAKKK